MRSVELSNGLSRQGRLAINKGGRESRGESGRAGRGGGTDGVNNDRVTRLGGEGEGSWGSKRFVP